MRVVVDQGLRAPLGLPLYQQQPLRLVAGQALRPGGLELTERMLSLCGLPPGARLLDVGCGTGATVAHAIAQLGLRAAGLDLSLDLLQEGRDTGLALPLLQAAGERLPLACGSIDAVIAECTLSLMTDLDQALAEWRRVLRPDGTLAIADLYARQPEGAAALHRLPLSSCLSAALPREEILARVQALRLEVLLWEDHTPALKRFAAELILAHGSLESFWCRTLPRQSRLEPAPQAEIAQIAQAVAAARPGYFLLLARALP